MNFISLVFLIASFPLLAQASLSSIIMPVGIPSFVGWEENKRELKTPLFKPSDASRYSVYSLIRELTKRVREYWVRDFRDESELDRLRLELAVLSVNPMAARPEESEQESMVEVSDRPAELQIFEKAPVFRGLIYQAPEASQSQAGESNSSAEPAGEENQHFDSIDSLLKSAIFRQIARNFEREWLLPMTVSQEPERIAKKNLLSPKSFGPIVDPIQDWQRLFEPHLKFETQTRSQNYEHSSNNRIARFLSGNIGVPSWLHLLPAVHVLVSHLRLNPRYGRLMARGTLVRVSDSKLSWNQLARFWNEFVGPNGERDPNRVHLSDPIVISQVQSIASLTSEPLSIGDIGCGNGYLSRAIRNALPGVRIIAVDPATNMLSMAEKYSGGTPSIDYRLDSGSRLDSIASETFNLIIMNYVLQDCENMQACIAQMARVLKPGGYALVTIPHPCFSPCQRRTGLDGEEQHSWTQPYHEPHIQFVSQLDGQVVDPPIQMYHRPLSDYLNAFAEEGLSLERTFEPKLSPEEAARMSAQELAWVDLKTPISITFRLCKSKGKKQSAADPLSTTDSCSFSRLSSPTSRSTSDSDFPGYFRESR